MKTTALFAFLFAALISNGQLPKLSKESKISALTCAAGNDLYSSFGHSAFRVQDPKLGLDVVYNYGTFDSDQPNFYLNFALGRMRYALTRTSFVNFLVTYEGEKRWVKEQILDLTLAERQSLLEFFEENYKPENRNYAYDPLFNNCATVVTDIFEKQFGENVVFESSHLKEHFTFRELIMQNLSWNSWSAFGINTAYGAVVDRKATVKEHMFLPYYALYQIRNTVKGRKPLMLRERTILDYPDRLKNGYFQTSPLFWFTIILLFFAVITYLDFKHQTYNKWVDGSLFLISGLTGLFLLFLWFATNHTSTVWNFNILWALPSNVVVAFSLYRKQKLPVWLIKYLLIAFALFALVLILWIFNLQNFSPLIILLMGILGMRYFLLMHLLKTK